jgi:hypothetical protein
MASSAPPAQNVYLNHFWDGDCDGCTQREDRHVHFWFFEAQFNLNPLDRLRNRQELALWMNQVTIEAGCRRCHELKQIFAPILLLL